MEKISWGFIGCGKVVETKSGMAFNTDNSKIHAIMRRNLNKAEESAKKFNAIAWYDDVDDLLNDKKINAVYIATPPGLHLEQAIKCCKKKLPTYIEKPFARNYEECLQIIDMYKQAKVPLFIAHYTRALSKFKKIKEMLNNGKIGSVLEIDFRLNREYDKELLNSWLYNIDMSGGGRFVDIAPHSIDIMVYLFGKFTKVFGLATNNNSDYKAEDIVTMCFETEKGALGTANFNLLAPEKSDKMIIYGSKGIMEFCIHSNENIIIKINNEVEEISIALPEQKPETMINEVIKEILTGEKQNTCSGEEALETYRIIDEVLKDYYNGRQNEFWKNME